MRLILFFSIFFISSFTYAQIGVDQYLVEFTDKNSSNYSIDRPEEFLSQKAIERRIKYNIPVTSQDFPPNAQYVDSVRAIGVDVKMRTKWFNAIVIRTTDQDKLEQIRALSFVKNLYKNSGIRSENGDERLIPAIKTGTFQTDSSVIDYGEAFSQISMVGGVGLHNRNYLGQGMTIAILDGGFVGANFMTAFDSLRSNGQILGTFNLVGGGTYVYQGTPHGSYVLSILAANLPGIMVGVAPKARYYLVRSEDTNGENIIELYNWVVGAEYADSVGVDIISSSLDYKISAIPNSEPGFSDLDGNTSPVSIAADIAASKGIIVVVSAGNDGENVFWPHIGFPADADSILTVGAVDVHGLYASFSSPGPTADGRIKPDVVALGVGTRIMQTDNTLGDGDGTSFATPIIAGLAACLWQAFPDKSNMEIIDAIKQSANLYSSPNFKVGYGLPDFYNSFQNFSGICDVKSTDKALVFPNPFTCKIALQNLPEGINKIAVSIINLEGQLIWENQNCRVSAGNCDVPGDFSKLQKGVYFLKITNNRNVLIIKTIKQ